MSKHNIEVKHIVILGGGSAGWLTAGVIAAEHHANKPDGIKITLIESPDVPTIGVGEGTWPSMRNTLSKMGVSETDLFRECDASFKQGAKFVKWVTGENDDYYYHPLILPHGSYDTDLVTPWQTMRDKVSFADAVCCQGALCDAGKAPKQITTPEYASVANYAYHLNATKLGIFLQKHCITKLGVNHIIDHVVEVKCSETGDIAALKTKINGDVEGDLFIDCSGRRSLLIGQHYKIPFISKKHILFNDSAIAAQVPYAEEHSAIASHTISTAQSAGWIWDIGLPTRKGVGVVFSSAHISDDNATIELQQYIEQSLDPKRAAEISFKKININPGHHQVLWHRNCVAVGMAAGFLEPLEASALVLVEVSAAMISNDLPATRDVMDIVAKRYNQRTAYYWETIIDFLKLHYILTKRTDTEYWIDNLDKNSISMSLQEKLFLWRHQVPNRYDFPLKEEMFPAASWQYVLYGMGFETAVRKTKSKSSDLDRVQTYFSEVQQITRKALSGLPSNRDLIEKINQFGFHKI